MLPALHQWPRKLSLLPLIGSTTQACSLPENLSGQRKRMLPTRHLCLISRLPLPSHSIHGVYSPQHWQRPLSAQCQHSSLLHCSARLCSLISHISCVAPFCRDILITGVSPDPTCSSQSRLSCFFRFQCWRRFWLKSFVTIVTTHIDLGMTLRLPSFNYLFIHCIGFHTENLSLRYFCIMY